MLWCSSSCWSNLGTIHIHVASTVSSLRLVPTQLRDALRRHISRQPRQPRFHRGQNIALEAVHAARQFARNLCRALVAPGADGKKARHGGAAAAAHEALELLLCWGAEKPGPGGRQLQERLAAVAALHKQEPDWNYVLYTAEQSGTAGAKQAGTAQNAAITHTLTHGHDQQD